MDNIQTRHLAGIATYMTRGQIVLDDAATERLREAIRQLEASTYVFITEEFDRSLSVLKREGVLRQIRYRRQNVSGSNGAVVSPDLRSEIIESNGFDQVIYEQARRLCELRFSSVIADAEKSDAVALKRLKRFFLR